LVALRELAPNTIDLLVTSPPYPMIGMWDGAFSRSDPSVSELLREGRGMDAFEAMHLQLDQVWNSAGALMKPHSTLCINVGDATRTISGAFSMYPNHSRITTAMLGLGYQALPEILWKKESNKPNKFMGSGMLPPGAYVTQEHEYIMLFRKGDKREFKGPKERSNRSRSAYFWEERNRWFTDVWEGMKGARQGIEIPKTRSRSAAFPFELAFRLVSMFSVAGDVVLDPFSGTGTTALASIASGRNSISIDIDPGFRKITEARLSEAVETANDYNRGRLRRHLRAAKESGKMKHRNKPHHMPVRTSQETMLVIPELTGISKVSEDTYVAEYSDRPLSLNGERTSS
jgi:modification methylase